MTPPSNLLLPRQARDVGPQVSHASNLGLVFAKFSGKLTSTEGSDLDKGHVQDQVDNAIGHEDMDNPCLDDVASRHLKMAIARVEKLICREEGEHQWFETTSSLACGLGLPNPMDNGIELHPTFGVPYIPGSSIKGMLKAWIELWADKQLLDEDIQRIFGTLETAGSVTFLDALPDASVGLQQDVMTPHYVPYHQEGAAPGDWFAPVPIVFYVVPQGTRFKFAMLPRCPLAPGGGAKKRQHEQALTDLDTAWSYLAEALKEFGLGAKTKAGYGRFEPSR